MANDNPKPERLLQLVESTADEIIRRHDPENDYKAHRDGLPDVDWAEEHLAHALKNIVQAIKTMDTQVAKRLSYLAVGAQLATAQFASLDHFLDELDQIDKPNFVVRVQLMDGYTQTSVPQLVVRQHYVNVQALDQTTQSLLSCAVVIGQYQHFHDSPFGPRERHQKALIDEHSAQVLADVKHALRDRIPGIIIRHGAWTSGLKTNQIQAATWSGLSWLRSLQQETNT